MNENNQPQSQQTDINRLQFEAKLSEFISSQQNIPPDIAKVVKEHFWDLIEDTRKAQPSHSPTEQPGDAKHSPEPSAVMDIRSRQAYHAAKHLLSDGCEEYKIEKIAELIARAPDLLSEVSTLRSKQAELVAENTNLRAVNDGLVEKNIELIDRCRMLQQDSEIYGMNLKSADKNYERLSAELEQLRGENARLKAECSSHEKERYEIYSFDSSQAMEIKALQSENARLLEQLRSERDKMKSDRDAWKGGVVNE